MFDTRVTSFRGMARGMGPMGSYGLAPTWQGGGDPKLLAEAVRQAPINFTAPQTQVAPQAVPPPINPAVYQPGIDAATQEGTSTAPASGIQGIARVGQALLAAKMRGTQMQAQQGQQQYQSDAVAKALAAYQSGNVDGAIQIATQAGLGPVVQALMAQRFAPRKFENVTGVGLVETPTSGQGDPRVVTPTQYAPGTGNQVVNGQLVGPDGKPIGTQIPQQYAPGTGQHVVGPNQSVVGPDGKTVAQGTGYDIPSGYRADGNGGLTPVAGGPDDTKTIAAQEAARNPFYLQDVRGPNGEMIRSAVPRSQIPPEGGVIAQGAAPAPTFEQSNAGAFANRLTAANAVLDKLDMQGTNFWGAVAGQVPGGNYLQTPDYQRYDRAVRDFINAQLRRESGAAIQKSEFDNAAIQYFPQPGDSEGVIADKRLARAAAAANMTTMAGPGYKPQPVPTLGTVNNPAAAGNDDVQQKATQAWGAYEPNRYDYRFGPNGNLQRKPK